MRALAPNSTLKNLLIFGAAVAIISVPLSAPLWGPSVLMFVQTAGVSASLAARDMLSLLLSETPELLLYNPNVQKYLTDLIISALESTEVRKNADGSFTLDFDSKHFIVNAANKTFYFALDEVVSHWDEANGNGSTGDAIGSMGGVIKSTENVIKNAEDATKSIGGANGGTGSKIEINTVDDLFDNPKALSNATPEEWYDYLQKNGYNPQPLGSKSSLNGVSFDQGGGFRINWGGDRYLQYHPSTASHHGGAYWKLSSGPTGAIRIDMNGNIIH